MEKIMEYIKQAQAGDQIAKESIILENTGLIWSIVNRFRGRGEPDDLYQIGVIGLLKCVEKFDFSYEVKFSTYAVPMIMGEIRRFLRDDGPIKISRELKELSWNAKKIEDKIMQEENREPSVGEIAAMLHVEKEQLIFAMESARPIESIYSSTKNDENDMQLVERLADFSADEKMIEYIALKESLKLLPQKERQIIVMRYFLDKTQTEVAKAIGISQVQVSRIEKKILGQLQKSLK